MTETSIEAFTRAHLDGLIALVAAEGWSEYAEETERTYRALTAPGVTTLVAMVGGRVAGAIQVVIVDWNRHRLERLVARPGEPDLTT